jgi:hypothetical protein
MLGMETTMLRIFAAVLVLAVATAPAMARKRDQPNYGFCEDGKKVKDIANCGKSKNKKK